MRVVIYDDESLEPITVLNLPLTEREMLERRYWRVPVHEAQQTGRLGPADKMQSEMRVVVIEFERFCRRTARHDEQRGVFAFTRAADLAMLLNPDWLPGQRSAIRYLQDQNDALTRMLMKAWQA